MINEMLQSALENWDFENADYPYCEMQPTIEGLIGSDLSEDQEVIDTYVDNADDWDGLQRYILAVMGYSD